MRTTRPGPWAVATASLAAFLILLAFLAWQLGAGRDPALGIGGAAPAPQPKKRILVRRIVKTTVVDPAAPAAPRGGSAASGAPQAPASAPAAASGGAAPAAQAPAPVPAPAAPPAPAPAPTPAPAPVPAPVTRSS